MITPKSILFQLGLFFLIIYLVQQWPLDIQHSPWSLAPALLAVVAAILTRKTIYSLFLSLLVGSILVVGDLSAQPTSYMRNLLLPLDYLWVSLSAWSNVLTLLFIIIILILVSIISLAGGFHAVVVKLTRYAYGRRSSQLIVVALGIAIFIDDYVNAMVVGSSTRQITDRFGISREKLAFLVDATSAPIAGIALVSTWVGYEVGLFDALSHGLDLGLGGYTMFLDAMAYRFYCIFMLMFVFYIAATDYDFAAMARAENASRIAFLSHERSGQNSQAKNNVDNAKVHSMAVLLWPLLTLFAVLFGGIWVDGGDMSNFISHPLAIISLNGWKLAITNASHLKIIFVSSALAAFGVAVAVALNFALLSSRQIFLAVVTGIKTALLPMAILLLAWALKENLADLHASRYLSDVLVSAKVDHYFPAFIFAVAAGISFVTGTSYGTMGILIPLAIPTAYALDGSQYGLITILSLAAVLDGSIFGDHCSPLSDTTIMSSTASQCDHISHVRTQLPYALFVGFFAIVLGYFPASLGLGAITSYLLMVLVLFSLFLLFRLKNSAKQNKTWNN